MILASSPDPYPRYAQLVADRPFHEEDGLWVAAGAEAVTAALTNPLCRVRPPSEPVPRALVGWPIGDLFGRMARMNDGPAHAALKPLLTEALGSARASEAARACARELRSAPGDFVFQLAPKALARLLGVELDDPALLARDLARCIAPSVSPEQARRGSAAWLQLRERLAAAGGGPLRAGGDPAVLANLAALFFQIYDATAGLIGNTLLAVARHREAAGDVRAAVLETLRWDPPVHSTRRFMAEAGALCGRQLHEGAAIVVLLAAANRDPAFNPRPDRFDPRRENARLFTFGAGVHACPGRTLALEIATAGVEELLASVDLDALDFTWLPSPNLRVPLFGGGSRYQ